MKDPGCLACGGEIEKQPLGGQWVWTCQNGCMHPLLTGVSIESDIRPFEVAAIPDGHSVNTGVFGEPLADALVPGAKVYMPFILYHFIGCTWGACYVMVFQNVIQPHLDCVHVLDYVLRSPVVRDDNAAAGAPKMYADLYSHLSRVNSPSVRDYVNTQFATRFDTHV
jgi:hypothetical protein